MPVSSPVSTSVNKPNIAALIAIVIPFAIWVANRFFGAGLTVDDANIINGAVGAVAAWAAVYATSNKPPQAGD